MAQVWDTSPLEGRALLIELALADFANDEGLCWPAIETVARKGRCSESWVHQVIRDLRKRGRLQVMEGGGRGKTNLYVLKPDAGEKGVLETPLSDLKGAEDSAERVQSKAKRVHSTAPRTVIDPSIEPPIQDMAETLPFEPKGTVGPEFIKDMIGKYPLLDVPGQYDQYTDHWLAHPKNKPKNDQAGFRNWLRKAEVWRGEKVQRNPVGSGARSAGSNPGDLISGWEAYARGE